MEIYETRANCEFTDGMDGFMDGMRWDGVSKVSFSLYIVGI